MLSHGQKEGTLTEQAPLPSPEKKIANNTKSNNNDNTQVKTIEK